VALALVLLQRQRRLATDTLLGILAHATLSLGLVTLAFMETVRVDLVSYLFGDILAITVSDLYWIWGGGILAFGQPAKKGQRMSFRTANGRKETSNNQLMDASMLPPVAERA
jgi:ABC-type Mn2+/Zn2+ transport system permease subunit